ncbi:MAG: glycoside hydrolase [Acidobacteria bacterium]|nr:glycoside hydrolase [Acidobacteriota bacterium]
MPEAKTHLVLLWHMHQPYYKDLVAGQYRLPWTRLHALKDYLGMVAMLEEFPNVHVTFNLVPSLLLQLEDYAAGTARETMQEVAYGPVEEMDRENRLFLLRYFFQANVEHLISRLPRYRELYDRMQANDFVPERSLTLFDAQDFRDLQVLSQLAWFDEIYLAQDPDLLALVSKGKSYSHADQKTLYAKQQQLLASVIEAYRTAAGRGQIEISTSPLYHPILPLLCDSQIATEAHPGVRLPHRPFRHPEDARLQLERAAQLHQRIFGQAPAGLWPSEGSVSEEVLGIAASLGFRWIATDQRILGNSIGVGFFRDSSGSLVNAERLYTAYSFSTPSGPIQMLFRDQDLSDRIGFVYSRLEPEAAATDFVKAVEQTALPLIRQGKNALVPVILDGENAWEYFPQNGRPFLRTLYRLLSEHPSIQCLTVSEALEQHGRAESLSRLTPGSWINANFDIWIGAEEDNLAWDLLAEAREWFEAQAKTASPESRALALEELLIAEGSDWCWWYGPEHPTAHASEFDALYRAHLSNVYRALGHRPPEALAQPIVRPRVRVLSAPPEGAIAPIIDGVVSNYFEWMGAGYYNPLYRATVMQGEPPLLRQLYYGGNPESFYLRMDFYALPDLQSGQTQLRISFQDIPCSGVTVPLAQPAPDQKGTCPVWADGETPSRPFPGAEAALGKILEIKLSLAALGITPQQLFAFRITLWEKDLPRETFPLEGWISVPVLAEE